LCKETKKEHKSRKEHTKQQAKEHIIRVSNNKTSLNCTSNVATKEMKKKSRGKKEKAPHADQRNKDMEKVKETTQQQEKTQSPDKKWKPPAFCLGVLLQSRQMKQIRAMRIRIKKPMIV
jgi:hypothetical protein